MSDNNKRRAPNGAVMEKVEDYLGVSIPKEFNIYKVTDENSPLYGAFFTFDEEGNHKKVEPQELLEKVKNYKKHLHEIKEEDFEREKIKTEEKFDKFLEEELGMSRSEYLKDSKGNQRMINDAFQTWLREKTSEEK